MSSKNEIRCCKCGKKLATLVNGEFEFRGKDIDWVRVTKVNTTEKTTKYKCRGCYTVNTMNEKGETTTDEKEVAKDLIYNFKRK